MGGVTGAGAGGGGGGATGASGAGAGLTTRLRGAAGFLGATFFFGAAFFLGAAFLGAAFLGAAFLTTFLGAAKRSGVASPSKRFSSLLIRTPLLNGWSCSV